MIATVRRLRDAGTLLRELFEPVDLDPRGVPHLIAGAGEPAALEPARRRGSRSRSLGRLAEWLNEPLALLPTGTGRRTAWHCTVQGHPGDRDLNDQQWAHIATDIMHRAGLAPRGDTSAVRWIAVRHGRDHIHLIATLARQDGALPPAGRDVPGVRKACHAAEDRYGLTSTRWASEAAAARSPGPPQPGCNIPAPVTPSPGPAGLGRHRWLLFAILRIMMESR